MSLGELRQGYLHNGRIDRWHNEPECLAGSWMNKPIYVDPFVAGLVVGYRATPNWRPDPTNNRQEPNSALILAPSLNDFVFIPSLERGDGAPEFF
jgi:hypothetical protein